MERISYLLFIAALIQGCSKDDDAEPNHFKDVPSGDIVAIELRNEVLTGFTIIANSKVVEADQEYS